MTVRSRPNPPILVAASLARLNSFKCEYGSLVDRLPSKQFQVGSIPSIRSKQSSRNADGHLLPGRELS